MQHIQHPTAAMIGKACTAQDDVTGDGTTSTVLLIGELLKQAELHVSEVSLWSITRSHKCLLLQGLHPRLITDGFDKAKEIALKVLDDMKYTGKLDRALLIQIAGTALRTKLHEKLADHITEVSVVVIYNFIVFSVLLTPFCQSNKTNNQ